MVCTPVACQMLDLVAWARCNEMTDKERRTAYGGLWALALAFGWIEASVVVYLREISVREAALHATTYLANLPIAMTTLPAGLVALEIAREACTIVLLTAVGWLAGRRPADRIGAFIAAFGVWDLTYYAVLRAVSGWPESISTWDILFLIPAPWVAPVWAPITVAGLFVLGGSYLYWTAGFERRYQWTDLGVLLTSACLTIAAFLVGSSAIVDRRVPEHFPAWLFWSGVVLGVAWFVRVERRAVQRSETGRRWRGVRGRTMVPTKAAADRIEESVDERILRRPDGESDLRSAAAAYQEAKSHQAALMREAGDLGERFERLAHGLSTHPGHVIIGIPDRRIEEPSEWDIVPSHALPSIEQLVTLTNDIRAVSARVEDLRERLILMGHPELVEQPNGFFH